MPAVLSNRRAKFLVASVVIFALFIYLVAQPLTSKDGIVIDKSSILKSAPGLSIPKAAPVGNTNNNKDSNNAAASPQKPPYEKTDKAAADDKKNPTEKGAQQVEEDVAPIKDSNAGGNKIQANKDQAASTPDSKNTNDSSKQEKVDNSQASKGKSDSKPAAPSAVAGAGAGAGAVPAKAVPPIAPPADGTCKDKTEYVIMIDAGSTGSRIHVYEFDLCFSPPKLLNEFFEMLKPGLSSFDTDAVGAAKSLDPLLQVAMKNVPENKRSCTPVAVKATAGLRLLGEEKSSKILKEVRRHLEEDYPFAVVEGDGISIMGGRDEGVYAWITTNYLLGNIGSSKKISTAAVFDLGGGSTQIVFEPTEGEKMIEGEHKYSISFGGRDFTLYQYSHLGYGLMEGRNKINSKVVETQLKDKANTLKPATAGQKEAKATLTHPCIAPDTTAQNVEVKIKDETYLVNFVSPATSQDDPLAQSAATQCRYLADTILNKELDCKQQPCSFNGIYQPSLLHQFAESNDMFVFSYFYDRLNPLGMPNSFTLDEMKELTKLVCSGSKFWKQYLVSDASIDELNGEPQWCLDLSYMISLLHTGYDIPLSRELKTAKKINNNELGWCLGASLPLLDKDAAGWKCRVKEVTA
ncbi:hypothetical protein PACTADRAFT_49517 [Pachysolen tannophilus NRRL Y-2460]|uniref:guanosine-diphosphatase n=1 Tax=Pachysolen tannophilus NRRL Y-2460 TaxID=669874 RepID=A0A1E4TWH5_PACTA|nr:hypothetical protein PACTADRAFT_49517 [Pachysolen tannophilus NRRL Y-2460]